MLSVVVANMSSGRSVILGCTGDLTSELLKSLALGLGDEKSGEDTAQHEEGEDLEDVVEPWGGGRALWCATGTERTDDDLRDDGTDFAGRGGETVRGGTVAGGEAFTRDDEGGGVRACGECISRWTSRYEVCCWNLPKLKKN